MFQLSAQTEKISLKIRIDVDYPYPSRLRSFIYTALAIKVGKDYLKNSKIITRMINESKENVKACWFFTPKTIPDKELLRLLDNEKHEIGLHVINDPYAELKTLEEATGKKVNYYTVHGTARFLARIMWKRGKTKKLKISNDFPLQSYYQFTTSSLDVICHTHTTEQATELARKYIAEGHVIHFHPIWLFQRGRMNHRGPFYETLKSLLDVDRELDSLETRRKIFFKIARDGKEYERNVMPTGRLLEKLKDRGVDIFTFLERKWCCTIPNPSRTWWKANDNVGLIQITSFEEWLKSVGKKTRNMIRKAEKSGIKTKVAEPSEELAEGVWRIYNETPIRQERGFPHYGVPIEEVRRTVLLSKNSSFIASYFGDELAGFIQLVRGDDIAIISQILALQKHWDKAVNNALIAKAVETCAHENIRWLMYGRMGNHPSLDNFKINNGCVKFDLTRYYVPLTAKGKTAASLRLHREIKDVLPQAIKYHLFPIYNWISRTRAKIKNHSKPK
jgi:hypothetical protein